MKPRIKGTKEYQDKRQFFKENLEYLFTVIQRFRNDTSINLAHKARILDESRETINNWIGKATRESLPPKPEKYNYIVWKVLDEIGGLHIPLKGKELITIDIKDKYGIDFEKLLGYTKKTDTIEGLKEPSLEYSSDNVFKDFLYDIEVRLIYKPSKYEIDILSDIKFPIEFPPTIDIYKGLLILYRQSLADD